MFFYVWVGSHHLHYTALPQWVQTLGMTFSVMLLVPSWATAANALLTLNGAWHKVRDDATLRFMMVAAIFYGLTTFEGSFLAIRGVNALSHYTDWTVAHVHAGTLGWNSILIFGAFYAAVPVIWRREQMWSPRLVEWHFWLAVMGTVIYVFAMWNSGILQGLMWRTYTDAGTLQYPFIESVVGDEPLLHRPRGRRHGVLRGHAPGLVQHLDDDPAGARRAPRARPSDLRGGRGRRAQRAGGVSRCSRSSTKLKILAPFRTLFHGIFRGHYQLERYSLALAFGIIVAGGIGGAVEIAPLFTIDETVEEAPDMRVYTPLEQVGRDIYMREGCYACHSQMIRTLADEVDRWGPYSLAVESKYDHPMLWGSKRTGPDLARVGGKYSDAWHVAHLYYPRDVVPDSVMPAYRWLARRNADLSTTCRSGSPPCAGWACPTPTRRSRTRSQDALGQVNPDGDRADGLIERYGEATNIRNFDDQPGVPTEMDAIVAYLQILGQLIDVETARRPNSRRSERMDIDHDTLVAFAKTFGLFYLIVHVRRRRGLRLLAIEEGRVRPRRAQPARRRGRPMSVKERDPLTGHQTTGHEWNGITELNTRVPRAVWWFDRHHPSLGADHVDPAAAWPLVTTYTKGILGIDQRELVAGEIEAGRALSRALGGALRGRFPRHRSGRTRR